MATDPLPPVVGHDELRDERIVARLFFLFQTEIREQFKQLGHKLEAIGRRFEHVEIYVEGLQSDVADDRRRLDSLEKSVSAAAPR